MDRAEFERSRRLFDGKLVETLDDKKVREALLDHVSLNLGPSERFLILHDGSDLRKPYSETMEHLGHVRSLSGEVISGYPTFNSVILDEAGRSVQLLDHSLYSSEDPHYILSKELKDFTNGKLQKSQKAEDQSRHTFISNAFQSGKAQYFSKIIRGQLLRVSEGLKQENPEIKLVHVLDRGHDESDFFRFIDKDLNDEFVIRIKTSRNSNQTELNEITNKMTSIKLHQSVFSESKTDQLTKVMIKNKVYQDLKRVIEWDRVTLNEESYSVIRIQLFDRKGKALFKQPMLLISNRPTASYKQALDIYTIYLKRSKIEGVFKFLKEVLGWEEFQVRDFETIKNLVAFCFYVAAYFYEIESALIQHDYIKWLCQLGKGKGKVTRYFLLRGLQKLIEHQQTERFFIENDIPKNIVASMFAMAGARPSTHL